MNSDMVTLLTLKCLLKASNSKAFWSSKFFMDSHQSNSLDSFFFESYLNSIEKGRLVVTDGVKNLGFGLPVMLIKLGLSLHGIAYTIVSNRHEIEFNQLRMLISHIINSDAGNTVIFLIDVIIVKMEEHIDEGIGFNGLFEDLVDKFFVFRDFKDEFKPDSIGFERVW